MRSKRRRSDRSVPAPGGLGASLEALETRQLLTAYNYFNFPGPLSVYRPQDLQVLNPITNQPTGFNVKNAILSNPTSSNPLLGNEGKIVTGKDRAGDEWTITVHGPGYAIVTDITPNDGSLDDAIDTIQLVGTNINTTYVTGNVTTSFRVQDDSTIPFNHLIDTGGVRSVILNGFSLSDDKSTLDATAPNTGTSIELLGGVRYLSFANIVAPVDTSQSAGPVDVIIGDPSTPLPKQVQPVIHLESIFNTVFDSTATTVPALIPQTTPTVSILVNGAIKDLSFISTGQDRIIPSDQFLFPTVATTGRTAVQATAIGSLNVAGGATNFTASRSGTPFGSATQNGFNGLAYLKSAHFAGPTDAVGLDVTNGAIGTLRYDKGIGNPAGSFLAKNAAGEDLPATGYGLPADKNGYPATGLLGGEVTARSIKSLTVGPANYTAQTPSNPDFVQLLRLREPYYVYTPGNALTNAVVATSGSIGKTTITGNSVYSEVKSGFHYPSFAAGLEGTRAASKIGPYKQNGSLVGSVTSATYRPYFGLYGNPLSQVGNGRVTGNVSGTVENTGGVTGLGNVGAGVYAAVKRKGYLPPPSNPVHKLPKDVQYQ